MHLADNVWIVIGEFLILFGLLIGILVKLTSTFDKK